MAGVVGVAIVELIKEAVQRGWESVGVGQSQKPVRF